MFTKHLVCFLVLSAVSVRSGTVSEKANFEDTGVFDLNLHEAALDAETCNEHLNSMSLFEYFDASFRIPKGVLTGNLVEWGNYHQCLAIRQPRDGQDLIEGKHCVIQLPLEQIIIQLPDLPWARGNWSNWSPSRYNLARIGEGSILPETLLELGVCIPKSCTVQQALSRYFDNGLASVDYAVKLCRITGDKPFVPADYLTFVIISIICLLTILSTCYELYNILLLSKDPKDLNELYACGSLYRNTNRLFTFSKQSGTLDCLDGLRACSILWVIIVHTALLYVIAPAENASEFYENIHLFYLNRFLRMFPVLALAVLLQASLFHHVDDGARWDWPGIHVHQCRVHWWAALLHIQNYYNPLTECLPHTWYLSVDFQLHLLSPLVLIWVFGSRRSAWTGLSISFLITLTVGAAYNFLYVNKDNHFTHYYFNTLTRLPVFLVGMCSGYILHIIKDKKLRLSWPFVAVGWLASSACMITVMFSFYAENSPDIESHLIERIVDSFGRPIWTACLAWIVFACVHGYGGPVNWFLSLTVWKFVARISYAMYIFHYPLQFIRIGGIIKPDYFSYKQIFIYFSYDLMLTIIASGLVTVIVDAPFSTLQRMLLGGVFRKKHTIPEATNVIPGPAEKPKQ